jgi:hypothetical protein
MKSDGLDKNNWYIEELNEVKYAMRSTVKNKCG